MVTIALINKVKVRGSRLGDVNFQQYVRQHPIHQCSSNVCQHLQVIEQVEGYLNKSAYFTTDQKSKVSNKELLEGYQELLYYTNKHSKISFSERMEITDYLSGHTKQLIQGQKSKVFRRYN